MKGSGQGVSKRDLGEQIRGGFRGFVLGVKSAGLAAGAQSMLISGKIWTGSPFCFTEWVGYPYGAWCHGSSRFERNIFWVVHRIKKKVLHFSSHAYIYCLQY